MCYSFFGTGGAENATQNIARRLNQHGYRVHIFLPLSEYNNHSQNTEFCLESVPDSVYIIDFRNVWFDRKNKKHVAKRLCKFDVVHFSMLHSAMALFPYFKHKNWSVSCRGGDIQNPRKTIYKKISKSSKHPIRYKGFVLS